jgi:tRNA pseudouridine38-40 synthase
MRTLKLTIAYDGTRFVGWQRQTEGVSIQGLLEAALGRFEGGPVVVHGAGRTDAGVHALGQVASAIVGCGHEPAAILKGLNAQLPPDVRVLSVHEEDAAFHARFSARAKTYRYLVRNGPLASPFERGLAWHVPEPLDVTRMQAAAAVLCGTHDFAAFQSSGSTVATTQRTIRSSVVTTSSAATACSPSAGVAGLLLSYEVTGDGFLRHMVRAIVGTLIDVGRRRLSPEVMVSLVEGGSRAAAGATAPAHGLFLVRVDYD